MAFLPKLPIRKPYIKIKTNFVGDQVLPNYHYHSVVSGADFNKYYSNKKFYKFLYNDLTHNTMHYRLGLNIDPIPFNPGGKCLTGGLYFCEKSKCYLYYKYYGRKIATIEIPNNAYVYVEKHKFKADKIIITDIIDFEDVSDEFWINILDDCRRWFLTDPEYRLIRPSSIQNTLTKVQDTLATKFATGSMCSVHVVE